MRKVILVFASIFALVTVVWIGTSLSQSRRESAISLDLIGETRGQEFVRLGRKILEDNNDQELAAAIDQLNKVRDQFSPNNKLHMARVHLQEVVAQNPQSDAAQQASRILEVWDSPKGVPNVNEQSRDSSGK